MTSSLILAVMDLRSKPSVDASLETLEQASRLSHVLGTQVGAVLLGCGVRHWLKMLAEHRADRRYLLDDPRYVNYSVQPFTQTLTLLIRNTSTSLVLFPGTCIGMDLAARVAARLGKTLISKCISIRPDPAHGLVMTRPVFGGQAHATLVSGPGELLIVTTAVGSSGTGRPIAGRTAQVVPILPETEPEDFLVKVVRSIRAGPKKNIDVRDAEIVVAGGRGVGSKQGFQVLETLAEVIGGSLAGTRPAVEAGWIHRDRQIGQTGRTVRPKLYIACGISGASQHNIGMKDSQYVIAINTDRHAPIHKIADLSIIGDLRSVVPELINEINDKQASQAEHSPGTHPKSTESPMVGGYPAT